MSVVVSGCAENAIFELTLVLPPLPAGRDPMTEPMYAFPQLRTGMDAFEDMWAGGKDNFSGFALDPMEATMARISVIGDADTQTLAVRLKTRFCSTPRCLSLDDDLAPRECVEFQRVFYVGKVTRFTRVIGARPPPMEMVPTLPTEPECDPEPPATPNPVIDVGRCSVAGCRDGDTTTYCNGGDGTHFCED